MCLLLWERKAQNDHKTLVTCCLSFSWPHQIVSVFKHITKIFVCVCVCVCYTHPGGQPQGLLQARQALCPWTTPLVQCSLSRSFTILVGRCLTTLWGKYLCRIDVCLRSPTLHTETCDSVRCHHRLSASAAEDMTTMQMSSISEFLSLWFSYRDPPRVSTSAVLCISGCFQDKYLNDSLDWPW